MGEAAAAPLRVPRPRLARLIAPDDRVVLLLAGPGYGKSVLLEELAGRWDGPVAVARGTVETGRDGAAPTLVLIDDADAISPEDLFRLVEGLGDHDRLVVAARGTGPGAGAGATRLRDPEPRVLLSGALEFTPSEIAQLAESRFEVPLTDQQAEQVRRITGGWPRAVVEVLRELRQSTSAAALVDAFSYSETPVRSLLRDCLRRVEPAVAEHAPQLAHLPQLYPEVVDAALGSPGAFQALVGAGVPLTPVGGGRWGLPAPVQGILARQRPLAAPVAVRAAGAYRDHGEALAALRVLVAAALGARAGALLDDLEPETAERLDWHDLEPLAGLVGDDALRAHPVAALRVARAVEVAGGFTARARWLARCEEALADHPDPRWSQAVAAEAARDLARDGRLDEAAQAAEALLVAAEDLGVRARALLALAEAGLQRGTPSALAGAERLFEEAGAVWRGLREPGWAVEALLGSARVLMARVRPEQAAGCCLSAKAQLDAAPRLRGHTAALAGEAALEQGDLDAMTAHLHEASLVAGDLGDTRLDARVSWTRLRAAARAGEKEQAGRWLRRIEEAGGDWRDTATGGAFLAEAAELCAMIDETALAGEYLRRAGLHPATPPIALAIAEAAGLARSGDPAVAEERLAALDDDDRCPPRDRWRVPLLRAWAAYRAGDPRAAGHAVRAFEKAALLGTPGLPLLREPAIAARLVALAAEAGSRAAGDLAAGSLPVTVVLLGDFAVLEGGRHRPPPRGMAGRLLKVLAVGGGRLHREQVVERLWPDDHPDVGRYRLRNVLSRLNRECGKVAVRDGDSLLLHERVHVDWLEWEREAEAALASRAPDEAAAMARAALAHDRGDVLPSDRYDTWAEEARRRQARLRLALVDLLADDAQRRGALEEMIEVLERAIAWDPYDESRYVRAARGLMALDRYGHAAELVARARRALAELDVVPSPPLQDLERELRAP